MRRAFVRPLAVILFCAAVVMSNARLHADMGDFCDSWDANLDEPNDLWCFDNSGAYTWAWNGGYDISAVEPEEDRLFLV